MQLGGSAQTTARRFIGKDGTAQSEEGDVSKGGKDLDGKPTLKWTDIRYSVLRRDLLDGIDGNIKPG